MKAKVKEWASPTKPDGEFVKELRSLVTPKAEGANVCPIDFSSEFQKKLLDLLGSAAPGADSDANKCEFMFNKLRKDPVARSRLENIHAARAHRYGSAHFGPKFWYKENHAIAKKLKCQADRRKFRQALRADLDFINQLNLMDFEDLLNLGKAEALNLLKLNEPVTPSELFASLRNVPPLSIIRLINEATAEKITKVLQKISQLAHFSQSMADYFAHDDALEPALAVLCEVLRNAPEIGAVLNNNCQTFLGLANCFQKLRSDEDHDIKKFMATQKPTPKGAKETRQFRPGGRPSIRPGRLPFRPGLCFRFQMPSGCSRQPCNFTHNCAACNSQEHGRSNCPKYSQ